MSVINISFDTKEKSVICTVDGVEVPDFSYASVYRYCVCEGKVQHEICVESQMMDEETGIRYRKLMTANELEAKTGLAKEIPNSDGLYAYSSSKKVIEEDVSKMLGRS